MKNAFPVFFFEKILDYMIKYDKSRLGRLDLFFVLFLDGWPPQKNVAFS